MLVHPNIVVNVVMSARKRTADSDDEKSSTSSSLRSTRASTSNNKKRIIADESPGEEGRMLSNGTQDKENELQKQPAASNSQKYRRSQSESGDENDILDCDDNMSNKSTEMMSLSSDEDRSKDKRSKENDTEVEETDSTVRRSTRDSTSVKKKSIVIEELELTSSEEENHNNDNQTEDNNGENEDNNEEKSAEYSRARSPTVPEDQWEIEDVLDYVNDDRAGHLYFIKWKNWEPHFNTWEPPAHLVNCDDSLLKFYLERKAAVEDILAKSEYVTMSNGKRRRRGPALPHVPPDPRSLDDRIKQFFDATEPIDEEVMLTNYAVWNKRYNSSKGKDKGSRWPITKVDKYLQDGMDGKLTERQLSDFRQELVFVIIEMRKKALVEGLQKWQAKINIVTNSRPFIVVENEVDFEGPPEGFEFVNDYIPAEGITIPNDPPVGCSCEASCYDDRKTCCAEQSGSKFAYTRYRKVAVEIGTPIYECNRKCKCGHDCPNRVVQDGATDVKLSIFRTSNGCGWGVKALKSIKRGCFVTLYVGEVINADEAERRAKADGDGHTYLFDLDYNDLLNPLYSVDAMKYGNVAHFINHSCNPNLGVYAVWSDCLDPNLPKLAMFALRDISRGEELSFDYTNQLSGTQDSQGSPMKEQKERDSTKCLCGAPSCKKFIFY